MRKEGKFKKGWNFNLAEWEIFFVFWGKSYELCKQRDGIYLIVDSMEPENLTRLLILKSIWERKFI